MFENLRKAVLAAALSALAACGGGGGDSGGQPPAGGVNRPPAAAMVVSGDVRANAADASLSVTIGGLVRLDGTKSNDPDKDALTYAWTLLGRPDGSAVAIGSGNASQIEFKPDVLGSYTVALKVSDGKGGSNTQQMVIRADNQAPVSNIVVQPQFTPAVTNLPQQTVTVGGVVTLDGKQTTDPDGHAITVGYELIERPNGSTAALNVSGEVAVLTTDTLGLFKIRARGTDGHGGSFESIYSIKADNRAPSSSIQAEVQFTPAVTNLLAQSVTVGASIVLDGSGTIDADGDIVQFDYQLIERPVGSAATLAVSGKTARTVADVRGQYRVRVRGSDGNGGSSESIHSFVADNWAPDTVVVASATNVIANGGTNSLSSAVGYDVILDGASSSDLDGDALTHDWQLVSKPQGSAVAFASTSGSRVTFSPDLLGDYVVKLTVTDIRGAKSQYTTTVTANNRRPIANIATNATPQSLPAAPSVLLPLGTEVTLRGSGSIDADGDALSYAWTFESRPQGSVAQLSAASVADPVFTADVEGSYVLRLKVTDALGAFSERTIRLNIGTHAPVAVISRSSMTVVAGDRLQASAALSSDEDGDSLSYAWAVDARPVGSTANIAIANTAELAFTPDLPGTYVLSVRVGDGRSNNVAYLNVRALASASNAIPLNFAPDYAKYSKNLDKLVLTATNPDAVHIVDPFTGTIRSVPLPLPVKNFSLSPNGKLAAVLHEGIVTLIDLTTATLVHSSATGGAQTDAFVLDSGAIYLIGQTGGQWVDEAVVVVNGRTGERIYSSGYIHGSSFYGTQYGVLADRLNKVLFMPQGLSPSDISYFYYDPVTNSVGGTGDSPYHGDYPMNTPLYLTENQSIVFSSYLGAYYRTDTLQYAGMLSGLTGSIVSMSNSSAQQELLLLQDGWVDGNPVYPASYKRYYGALFLPDADIALPAIGGTPSYGIGIFHSAADKHVALVQTGTNAKRGAGVRYHVIVR